MKEHIIRAILYQDMSVKWKDAELNGGVNVHLNVHQKTRQFVEVELGDFLLTEGEAILAAFEKESDGEAYHENPAYMDRVRDQSGVFYLQIPTIVHNTPGVWGCQFYLATDYNKATGVYSEAYPFDIVKFSEGSSFLDDGLEVPSKENLSALYKDIEDACATAEETEKVIAQMKELSNEISEKAKADDTRMDAIEAYDENRLTVVTLNLRSSAAIDLSELTIRNLIGATRIDWGDGTVTDYDYDYDVENLSAKTFKYSHTYAKAGTYSVKIYNCRLIGGNAFNCLTGDAGNISQVITDIEIADIVTELGTNAFEGCTRLKRVIFGENSQLKTLNGSVFANCSALERLDFPPSLTTIGNYCMLGCGALVSVTFGKNSRLTSMGNNQFKSCLFSEIELPAALTSLGDPVFNSCPNLKKIVFLGTTPPTLTSKLAIKTNSDTVNDDTVQIIVPRGCVEAYEAKWAGKANNQITCLAYLADVEKWDGSELEERISDVEAEVAACWDMNGKDVAAAGITLEVFRNYEPGVYKLSPYLPKNISTEDGRGGYFHIIKFGNPGSDWSAIAVDVSTGATYVAQQSSNWTEGVQYYSEWKGWKKFGGADDNGNDISAYYFHARMAGMTTPTFNEFITYNPGVYYFTGGLPNPGDAKKNNPVYPGGLGWWQVLKLGRYYPDKKLGAATLTAIAINPSTGLMYGMNYDGGNTQSDDILSEDYTTWRPLQDMMGVPKLYKHTITCTVPIDSRNYTLTFEAINDNDHFFSAINHFAITPVSTGMYHPVALKFTGNNIEDNTWQLIYIDIDIFELKIATGVTISVEKDEL